VAAAADFRYDGRMRNIIYLVGLVVIVLAVLRFAGIV